MAVANAGAMALKVYIDAPEAVATVATVLENAQKAVRAATRGQVYLCLMSPELPGEVDMDLGQDFAINPEIKGAIKSLDGVMAVEDV